MRRGLRRALARHVRWALVGPVICLAVALPVGIVGFESLGHSHGVPGRPMHVQRTLVDRLPTAITGAPAPSRHDPLAEPPFAHRAVALHQLVYGYRAEVARAAAEELRSVPRALSLDTAPAPPLPVGTRVSARITFYYCANGPGGPTGDGGGFCGQMADGAIVYSGAAACDPRYLGQRFRIIGDPTDRAYTCTDTGSAIHGLHRDIWFATNDAGNRWQAVVGYMATIQILP